MTFLEGFVDPEKITIPQEIESIKKSHWHKNNYLLAGTVLFGVIGGIITYNFKETNPLEGYLCTEQVNFDEGLFRRYVRDIKSGQDVKAGELEILKFITERDGNISEVDDEKYLNLPIYSKSVCWRLYGEDKSKWPK